MKSSIRKFLLINLLVALTVTTSLTAIGNYYLDQKDIQEHMDTLMAMSALSSQALLGEDIQQRPIDQIQHKLEQIGKQLAIFSPQSSSYQAHQIQYTNQFAFQVWTNDGKLLLRSAHAPDIPLYSDTEGFSDKMIGKNKWRVFTTDNPTSKVRMVVAEHYDTRNALGKRISEDDLYIMLLTFPLTGLLIWIIIGRGLSSLERVAKEVANRAPNHLAVVSVNDIPQEIKPLVDELNQLFFRLKEGFEREQRFAADAAHELRTPLAALKAQAQVAINIDNLEEKNIALNKLIAAVNRTTRIVQQLLTMSQLVPEVAGTMERDLVDLVKITKEVTAMLATFAVEKHITLEVHIDDAIPSFQGNPTAIGILVRNLIDNAIRYCKINGEIHVRVYPNHEGVTFEVEDNGPGIPPELQSRVFERFFRVLGNKSPGSGLGLAIVQQICTLHHGTIHLASPQNGTGLIVRVLFPLQSPVSP